VLFLAYIPTEVVVGLLIWIGVVITALAFDEELHSRKAHGLAVAVGLIPCLGGYVWSVVSATVSAVDGLGLFKHQDRETCPSMSQLSKMFGSALYFEGIVALSQGFLFTSLIWSAIMVFIIDREFERASAWMLTASVLSMVGLIHGCDKYEYDHGCYKSGIKNQFGVAVAPEFGFAYLCGALVLLFLQWYDQGSLAIANKLHSLIIRPKRRGSFGNHGSFVQQSTSSLSFKGGSEHMEENVASTHSQPLMGASQHM